MKWLKTCKLIFSLKSLLHIWPAYVILNAYFAICTYDSRVCGEHGAKITLFRDIELPVIHLFRFCHRVPLPNKARKFQLPDSFRSPRGEFHLSLSHFFLHKTKTQTTFWISLQWTKLPQVQTAGCLLVRHKNNTERFMNRTRPLTMYVVSQRDSAGIGSHLALNPLMMYTLRRRASSGGERGGLTKWHSGLAHPLLLPN